MYETSFYIAKSAHYTSTWIFTIEHAPVVFLCPFSCLHRQVVILVNSAFRKKSNVWVEAKIEHRLSFNVINDSSFKTLTAISSQCWRCYAFSYPLGLIFHDRSILVLVASGSGPNKQQPLHNHLGGPE